MMHTQAIFRRQAWQKTLCLLVASLAVDFVSADWAIRLCGFSYPDPITRCRFMELISATDLFYPDVRIKNVAERIGVLVLNLAKSLQDYAERQ